MPLQRYKVKGVRKQRWVANVFCPTGEGGGVDPTCSPGGIRAVPPSPEKFGSIKDAEHWAKANGAKTVTSNPKVAAQEVASEVSEWVADLKRQDRLVGDAPTKEEVAKNWLKTFRSGKENEGDKPAFKDLNPELGLEVQNAINSNHANTAFREFVDEHGDVPVIFRRAEKGRSSAAEWRGAIHVYDSPFWKGEGTDALLPGGATAGGLGGYGAVLRHEYGHKLYGKLTADQQREWSSLVPESVAKDLTSYAAKNKEEAFCELFAIKTDSRYQSGVFPAWVDHAHEKQREWLLK